MGWFGKAAAAPHRVLGDCALLAGLSDRQLRIVHGFVHERHFLAGEIVFDAGEVGQALYFVLDGEVAIRRQGEVGQHLARLGPGGFFGEMALIADNPRSAQALAATDCTLAALAGDDFERLMASHAGIASQIALQLARHLGERLRGMLLGQVSAPDVVL